MKFNILLLTSLFLNIVLTFVSCWNSDINSSETKDEKKNKSELPEIKNSSEIKEQNDLIQEQLKAKIDSIFEDYLNEKFIEYDGPKAISGFAMQLPSGKKIIRDILISQAAPLIAFGREAIPYICLWMASEYPYIQFIAEYSLLKIRASIPEKDENTE